MNWPYAFLVGAVAGMLGQGARIIVGLKKTADAAASSQSTMADLVEPSRLFVSLLIGAIAGALCAVGLNTDTFSQQNVLAIAAAGYAGADFVEGFMRRVGTNSSSSDTPDADSQNNSSAAAAPPADDAVG